eukprot:m.11348 g.11348  ORF g.11348 m.11348 type:complete len:328 (-) comp6492_c0_seq1:607-1590(-)
MAFTNKKGKKKKKIVLKIDKVSANDSKILQVENVRAEKLDAIDVVGDVQLLVLGMGTIVATTHGQQQHILASCLLEGQGDGDTASFASQIGLNTVNLFSCLSASQVVGMVEVGNPGAATMFRIQRHFGVGVQLRMLCFNMSLDLGKNVIGLLVRHKADGEFPNDLARNDSLGTLAVKCTLNTMNGQGRESPATHQGFHLAWMRKIAEKASVTLVTFKFKVNGLVNLPFVIGNGSNGIVDARNQNVALHIHQRVQQLDQVNHWFAHCAAKDTRVKILCGTLHSKEKVANATETVGDARLGGTQPVVITDAHAVNIRQKARSLSTDKFL